MSRFGHTFRPPPSTSPSGGRLTPPVNAPAPAVDAVDNDTEIPISGLPPVQAVVKSRPAVEGNVPANPIRMTGSISTANWTVNPYRIAQELKLG